ncbi:MAG: hypothetical protein G8345_01240 [Magnetococcales bacterium]|nr:hypothetical protein [Magnetococcales bacterium]NGZ25495.1 hypothetical protein [Magnetococcales bacterium]
MLNYASLFIMNLQLNVQAQLWPVSEQRHRKIREMGQMVMNRVPAIRNADWNLAKKEAIR